MLVTIPKCNYKNRYTHAVTKKNIDYKCPMDAHYNDKCIFHDYNYLTTKTEKIVRDEFFKQINLANDKSMPMECIGFKLPEINLENKELNIRIYFVKVVLHNDITFQNSKFLSIIFENSKVFSSLSISNSLIDENLIFNNVKFFNSKIYLDNITVRNKSIFLNTKFDDFKINECILNSSSFRHTSFKNKTTFQDITFMGKCDFHSTDFKGIAKFDGIDFKEQHLVYFEGNLSKVSFKNSNITRIKFDEKTWWGVDDKYTILDDRVLKNNPEKNNLSSVLAIYRNLRENYEFHLMYEAAGQFFIKEMELKRNYYEEQNIASITKKKRMMQHFSLISIYHKICSYGESLKKISLLLISLFCISFIYFFLNPDVDYLEKMKPFDVDNYYSSKITSDVLYHLKITLNRLIYSFYPNDTNGLSENFLRLLGLPLMGILFVVLRRRFERRFRH